VLREKYERLVSERLGISLEAFRAQKIAMPEKKFKKPSVELKNDNSGPSRAVKYLAALMKFGGVEIDEPLDFSDLNDDELSLVYEQEFANRSATEKQRDAENLLSRVKVEMIASERKRLAAAIEQAEKDGDEEKALQLLAEMNKLIKK
jgi:hypothetical protein